MILMLITTVWLGSLGFADDYIKIFKKDKEGLHGKFKIIGQVGLGLIVGLTLYLSPDVVIRENIEVHTPGQEMEVIHGTNDLKSTQTTIPFFKSNNLDYADLVGFMGEQVLRLKDVARIELGSSSRSEERRVGKECLRLCRSRWSPYH